MTASTLHMVANTSRTGMHPGGRPTKHPWRVIEDLYVQGEDINKPGKGGRSEPSHEWPTQTDLANRYGIRLEQVSRRFARVGLDGTTAHHRRKDFQAGYQRHVDDKLARDLAAREIRFRMASMVVAELGIKHIAGRLARRNTGGELVGVSTDDLAKLLTAAKRAQEVGMVALDRPANGSEGGALEVEDWSLMREIRRGAKQNFELLKTNS